ncbi:MAG: septum formation initiator family protein [Muribaculaceae bacterium]|nr:septum formation initiator family protein [Muribaculaceae bacterium]MBP5315063.1 septum formation initiator family protein [Muribaculaceae bacterium]MBR4721836.1 septum formation initiator family protein [Muribaculaceae bacterium]MBR5435699.1 septum formation initiator family protein [Muribaculaceae bacterium]MBR5745416.1 septum formation initiator family protein [Muribaculaceae bacterium]
MKETDYQPETEVKPSLGARIKAWCRRYLTVSLFAVIAFMVYILFFSDYSILSTFELENELTELRKEIKQSQDSLEHYRQLNKRLKTDVETMEKIVREDYHMQRPNEDVYLVK